MLFQTGRLALSSTSESRKQALEEAIRPWQRCWNSGWSTDVLSRCGTQKADSIVDFLRVAHAQRIPLHMFHCVHAMSLCSQASLWADALYISQLSQLAVSGLPQHRSATANVANVANAQLAALASGSLWQLAVLRLEAPAKPLLLLHSFAKHTRQCDST